jgi:hypothetical protein
VYPDVFADRQSEGGSAVVQRRDLSRAAGWNQRFSSKTS